MPAFAKLTRPLALGLRAHPRQTLRYRSTMGVPDEHIHPHATGAAAKTVEARQAPQELVFYSGWFCPFVQRSWIALEEKGVPYQYKEVNPYKKEK
jgi:glutathione S-transferase